MVIHNGGLIQISAKGEENLYLTKDAQITWFKVQYRRHTNFSIETIRQNFTHTPDFGSKVYCNIGTKNGDLIHKMNLVFKIPEIPSFFNIDQTRDNITKFAWVRRLGYALIKEINIEIGGKLIDRHYGQWLNIWNELFNKKNRNDEIIGNIREIYDYSSTKKSYEIFVPLRFWFCNYINLSLPVICLFHNNLKINLEIEDFNNVHKISPTHYIQMDNDIVNFTENEYIKQVIDNKEIIAQYVGFDYITKRLYYNRISSEILQNLNIVKSKYSEELHNTYSITGLYSNYSALPLANIIEDNSDNNQILNSVTHEYNISQNIILSDCYLLVDYIFLDSEERKSLYKNTHEYIIEQLIPVIENQTIIQTDVNLGLYNCVKYIVWTAQQQYLLEQYNNDHFNYTDSYKYLDYTEYPDKDISKNQQLGKNLVSESCLFLNSIQRNEILDYKYYEFIQQYTSFNTTSKLPGINIYSFSINPSEFQPSGACNMSQIDNIKLRFNFDNNIINNDNLAVTKVYAVCYNILKIQAGLGNVVYVN